LRGIGEGLRRLRFALALAEEDDLVAG